MMADDQPLENDPLHFLQAVSLSSQDFAQRLVRSGLVDKEAVQLVWKELSDAERSTSGLAKALSAAAKLTPFQILKVTDERDPLLAIGSYVIQDKLGEGDMGQVYRAVPFSKASWSDAAIDCGGGVGRESPLSSDAYRQLASFEMLEEIMIQGIQGSPGDFDLKFVAVLAQLQRVSLDFAMPVQAEIVGSGRRYTDEGLAAFRALRPDVELRDRPQIDYRIEYQPKCVSTRFLR